MLASFDVFGVELPVVDYAEVDLADGVGIVVEECDYLVGVVGGNVDFLFDFAGERGDVNVAVVGAEEGDFVIDGVDVAPDADGAVADEARFAGPFAADIAEDLAVAGHYNVRDYLLV